MQNVSPLSSTIATSHQQRSYTRALVVLLLLAALVAGIWLERERVLRGAADLWIVSDVVTHADAVVVLGGGLEVRPYAAAKLYQDGVVNKILVSQVVEERSARLGVIPGHTELNRTVLLKLGVPEAAIDTFGTANKNSAEEATALRTWADQNHATVIIIPTEIFTSRRLRWILSREFDESSVRIEVPAFDPPGYTRAEWWKTEPGLIAFQNEVLKYVYY